MKTQISFKKADGGQGTTLVNGAISDPLEAKRTLADKLSLPEADAPDDKDGGIDTRLERGGIDPHSITFHHISE